MLRIALGLAAAALVALPATAGAAVVLQTDGSGHLTGATGVVVDGATYNVAFVDGTCASVFGSCTPSNFAFTTLTGATDAGQALLDQVFTGTYDDNPNLTSGCSSSFSCTAYIPYALDGGSLSVVLAENCGADAEGCSDNVSSDIVFSGVDLSLNRVATYARFTAAATASVPEPSTWAMMLAGFGLMGFAVRRSRQRSASNMSLVITTPRASASPAIQSSGASNA